MICQFLQIPGKVYQIWYLMAGTAEAVTGMKKDFKAKDKSTFGEAISLTMDVTDQITNMEQEINKDISAGVNTGFEPVDEVL